MGLCRLFSVFLKQTLQFYNNIMLAIQYLVLGFEPTTS